MNDLIKVSILICVITVLTFITHCVEADVAYRYVEPKSETFVVSGYLSLYLNNELDSRQPIALNVTLFENTDDKLYDRNECGDVKFTIRGRQRRLNNDIKVYVSSPTTAIHWGGRTVHTELIPHLTFHSKNEPEQKYLELMCGS